MGLMECKQTRLQSRRTLTFPMCSSRHVTSVTVALMLSEANVAQERVPTVGPRSPIVEQAAYLLGKIRPVDRQTDRYGPAQ